MWMLPGIPVISEFTIATLTVSLISRMAALLGTVSEVVTPVNLLENLHISVDM